MIRFAFLRIGGDNTMARRMCTGMAVRTYRTKAKHSPRVRGAAFHVTNLQSSLFMRGNRWEASFFVFVDPPLSAFVSFALSLSFLLNVPVLLPSQHLSLYGSIGCFVYKAGGNPFLDGRRAPSSERGGGPNTGPGRPRLDSPG